jgi:hypothetical protein
MKKVFLPAFFALCFALTALPGAMAFACECGILEGMLRSAAERVVSGIAVPLDQAIREAASYEAANVHKDLVALREAVLMAKDGISGAVEALDRNSAEREAERTYEQGSQPETSCDNSEMGAGYQLGQKTLENARGDLLERILSRGKRYQRPLDFQEELASDAFPGPEKTGKLLGA